MAMLGKEESSSEEEEPEPTQRKSVKFIPESVSSNSYLTSAPDLMPKPNVKAPPAPTNFDNIDLEDVQF